MIPKNLAKNIFLFCEIRRGGQGSKVELFWRRFIKNDKSLSFVIVGSSPVSSTQRDNSSFLGLSLFIF